MQGGTTPPVHFVIAGFLERAWEAKDPRILLMAFRACGKSTLVGLFCAWLLMRAPDLRILVLSADLALAAKMVRNVKRIVERHPMTAHLKPGRADQWASDRFTVRREVELRDPSMLAKGIFSNLTGTRADVVICDDVEVPNTSDTVEKRAFLRERLRELDYIQTEGGMQLYVGTPHSYHTIYAETARTEMGEKLPFLYGFKRLVIPVLNKKGESAWPERFSLQRIEEIRQRTGPAHFKSQMMCAPAHIADGYFRAEQLRVYEADIGYREANGQAVLTIDGRRMVSVSAWWDPSFGAGGDRSVIAIVFTDETGGYWLHHIARITIKDRHPDDAATQQCRQVAELAQRFFLPSIALETNGLGKFLPGILRRELSVLRLSCGVREMVSHKPKNIRILESLDAVLAAQAPHVHRSVFSTQFVTELEEWHPDRRSGHDDYLDAVAGAISLEPVRVRRIDGAVRRPEWRGQS